MRTRITILFGALLIASAGLAQAQDTKPITTATPAPAAAPVSPKLGQVDFGFRTSNISGDAARFDRLSDVRDGSFGYVDGFRFKTENETTFFRAEAARIGYRDQRYFGEFQSIGRMKASFDWTQVPLFIGSQTRSLFTDQGGGVLTVPDAVRQAVQNGTATLVSLVPGAAQASEIRSRRDIANFNLTYTAARDVDVKVNVRNTSRNGHTLQSVNFGFGQTLEVGLPVDDRTTDVRTRLEWANQKGLFSVGYDASWYNQNNASLTWDNPSRYTDIAGGSAHGRMALWPTNNTNTFNVNGSIKFAGRSKASAALSFGTWSQNEPLLPNTINSALASPALERSSAEAKANITSMLYGVTSRPVENLWLSAKYRYYQYDTKTPVFENTAVVADGSIGTLEETEPIMFKRQTFDADASFTPHRYVGFDVGYSRENGDRTFRIYETTAEDTFRASVDSTGNQYVTARLKYEYSKRKGIGLDVDHLIEMGEQTAIRHFDIAPRNRTRVTAIVTVTPVSQFAINGSVGTGRDKYPDSYFGLRNNDTDSYTIGFDVVPNNIVNFGVDYGVDKYTALQWSRAATNSNATLRAIEFNDPIRDWSIDSSDKVKTFSANLALLKAIAKTDIRFAYDLSDGNSLYLYGVAPNSTIPALTQFTQQPKIRIAVFKADLQHFVRANLALGAGYWYQKYSASDPTLDPSITGLLAFPAAVLSGYGQAPYKANTGYVRMTYLW